MTADAEASARLRRRVEHVARLIGVPDVDFFEIDVEQITLCWEQYVGAGEYEPKRRTIPLEYCWMSDDAIQAAQAVAVAKERAAAIRHARRDLIQLCMQLDAAETDLARLKAKHTAVEATLTALLAKRCVAGNTKAARYWRERDRENAEALKRGAR